MATDAPTERFPVGEFVALEAEKRLLEARLEQIAKSMALLQGEILDDWADNCVKSTNVAGFNVHIRNDFVCSKRKDVPTSDVCAAMKANGLGSLVSPGYNAQSLKSRIKEMVAEDQVPEDLGALLRHETIPRLIAVKV